MSASDSWFERNEGFINFTGHLIAIGQRNTLIQQEAQTQALVQRGITQEEQRRAVESRHENCKNLLYDINQAAALISDEYATRPQQAYYEAILLKEQIEEIDLTTPGFLSWTGKTIAQKQL